MTPAARAIGIAGFLIAVALAIYAVAATFDRWPELVVAAWGASLGAGLAINGVTTREVSFGNDERPMASGPVLALQHQVSTLTTAVFAQYAATAESALGAALTISLGLIWVWTLSRLAPVVEHVSLPSALRAYQHAFQFMALVGSAGLMYSTVALETLWLWRPDVPGQLQGFVWFMILQFASLPLTLMCLKARS